jgi:uncharacterized protein involved in exopolysaccharide biosynthesis
MTSTTITTEAGVPYEDEIDLRRYRRFLTSHWMVLAGSTLAGALIAVAVGSVIPPRFQASVTMTIVPPSGATPLVLTPVTAKALLVNPTVVSETINELGLNRAGMTTRRFTDDALEVEPVPATNLVTLSVALPDPAKAREAAALLARKVIDLSSRVDRETPSASRVALRRQLDEADRKLKDAEERLVNVQVGADLDGLQAQTSSKVMRRVDLDKVAIEMESERARLATLEAELQRQPAGMAASQPRGVLERPRARPDERAIGETDPAGTSVHAMLEYDIAQSRARIAALDRQRRQTLAMTPAGPMATSRGELYRRRLELARAQAEYDARTRVYGAILSRYEETDVPAAGTPQLQILAGPVQPDQPMPRHRRQFAALGALIGIACGIVAAFVIEGRNIARLRQA